MTDPNQPASPETPPAEPAAGQAQRSRVTLWVLVAIGVLLALGALWYALFGAPRTVGPEQPVTHRSKPVSTPPGSTSASSTATTPTPTPLTESVVRDVMSQIDYIESSDTSITEYDHMVTHALAGIDLREFAKSTLEATSAIEWVDVGAAAPRIVTGPEKQQLVAQSVEWWAHEASFQTSQGVPFNATLGILMYPPVAIDRNTPDSYYQVIGQGLKPLALMFGAHDTDNPWDWKIESVSVTGTYTADVTYVASAKKHAGFHFVNPKKRYVKHLRFIFDRDGTWRLSAWTNWAEVQAAFDANVSPAGATVPFDEWWGLL